MHSKKYNLRWQNNFGYNVNLKNFEQIFEYQINVHYTI